MTIIREKCVETQEEIETAVQYRADRIELCSRLDAGGFTPEIALTKFAVEKGLSVVVMLRHRRDFLISPEEVRLLQKEIRTFRDLGVSGFVFGFLTPEGNLNRPALETLLTEGAGKETVFHMAFDEIPQERQFALLDDLAGLGFTRILTKGGPGKASENPAHLQALDQYAGGKIALLAGGGVTDANYQGLHEKTGILQFHGRNLAGPSGKP
ncbi:MAG: hypothetical protein LBG90_08300 [Spirochaetaceae bacterium]|jgi:copper homeostasis protein|nr:hypothetical protein [Spirochaetaceae bacterium]